MKDETYLQHPPQIDLSPGNRPLIGPIYQSVKFEVDDLDRVKAGEPNLFFYSRNSNPTVRQLECLLAHLQRREDCIAVGSGIAALSVPLLSLLKSGDHVIMFLESYRPTRYLVHHLLSKFGVTHSLLSITEMHSLEKYIQPGKTKLILIESPTNPMARIPDFEKLFLATSKHSLISVLDNTFSGFHQHGEYPFDLYVHSLTKFASGHGDVMAGAIIGNKEIISTIKKDCTQIGPTLDPHSAFLVLRGMRTYLIRYQQQSKNAMVLAEWLSTHPKITQVLYPGLTSHPDHALAKKQLKDFGSVVPFILKGGQKEAESFLKKLKLFHLAGSLGSTDSLVAPALFFFGMDLNKEDQEKALLFPGSLRLSVGLEDTSELIADLEQALK
jgi:cystathionine beta-lyase/cystathionine gamma-synthase